MEESTGTTLSDIKRMLDRRLSILYRQVCVKYIVWGSRFRRTIPSFGSGQGVGHVVKATTWRMDDPPYPLFLSVCVRLCL